MWSIWKRRLCLVSNRLSYKAHGLYFNLHSFICVLFTLAHAGHKRLLLCIWSTSCVYLPHQQILRRMFHIVLFSGMNCKELSKVGVTLWYPLLNVYNTKRLTIICISQKRVSEREHWQYYQNITYIYNQNQTYLFSPSWERGKKMWKNLYEKRV